MMNTQDPETSIEREDEDDYDLLTFGEARARLGQEVRKLDREVAALEADPSADPGELTSARARLATLRAAAERNARQPINDDNFTKFFGYEGKARRNTT